MDTDLIKESIEVKAYHLTAETKVPLHKHDEKDEIFYCIKGSGFGVLENSEEELTVGKAFIVPAGTKHSL
jgi:quercetin dioxygenase-like cupin family protein